MNRKEKIFPDAYDDPVRMQAQQFERAPYQPRAIGGDGGAIAQDSLTGPTGVRTKSSMRQFFEPLLSTKNLKKLSFYDIL
jgi:hypothetical protein